MYDEVAVESGNSKGSEVTPHKVTLSPPLGGERLPHPGDGGTKDEK